MRDNLLRIRGVAALGVVLNHTIGFPSGWIAVWLFFMLSAFLLTNGFIYGRFESASAFYVSRARRLLPAFLFVQIALIAIVATGVAMPQFVLDPRREILVLMTAGAGIAIQSINSPVWSVLLEIHFIILLPWILKPRVLPWAIAVWGSFLAYLASRQSLIWEDGWYGSHAFNAGFFLLGMSAAYAKKRPNRYALQVAVAAWLVTELFGWAYGFESALRYAPLILGPAFYLMLIGTDTSYQRSLPRSFGDLARLPRLEALGAISYTLYLSHKFIVLHVLHYLRDGAVPVVVSVAVSLAFASAVYVLVESRFRLTGREKRRSITAPRVA